MDLLLKVKKILINFKLILNFNKLSIYVEVCDHRGLVTDINKN